MQTPNEFWLQVHNLLKAYDAEGPTPDERAASITDELLRCPPIVQREVLGELQLLITCLPDLYPTVLAAVNARQHEENAHQSRAG
ncbi:MAG TPA: hypothetical protein VMP01_05665 [Pirellulaceae bacterium]|nr:hypothetical protein [Pirellulaceae bacterium]